MESILRELRTALRRLMKHPSSSLVAVLAMGLGIGLTASMFAILDGILLRGLPFEEADRLIHLERNNLSQGFSSMEVTQHDFEDWQTQQTSFEGLAGFTSGTFNLSDEGLPDRYNGAWISANFLELLRVQPLLGRGFEPADGLPGAEPVLLIGHHVWQKRYGGAADIIGRTVRVNSEPATLIGVLPEDFRFPILEDAWMPLILETGTLERGEGTTLEVFGRLVDGVTVDGALAEMSTIARRLELQYPELNEGVGVVLQPYLHEFVGLETRMVLGVMFTAVLLVLLISCFNVANLLIGRAVVRGRELAIRSALGSGRWRAIAQVLTEAALLAFGGAFLGVLMARFALHAFGTSLAQTNPPFWFRFEVDSRVIAVTVAAAVLSALIAGVVPAIQASQARFGQLLQDASRGSTSFRLGRLSRALVIAQVAISCALLVAAALAVRSVLKVTGYDLRIESERVLTARLGLFEGDYPEEADQIAFFDQLRDRVAGQAEVEAVAFGTVLPTDTEIGSGGERFERSGETYDSPRDMPFARLTVISPGYWDVLGVEMLAGRDFTAADRQGAPAVAIVNQDFVRKEWPGENPIGKRINRYLGKDAEAADSEAGWVEVVGVVPNLRFAEFDNADDQQGIYVPMAQNPVRFAWVITQTRGAPLAFAESLRRTVLGLDPNLPLYFVRSMDQVIAQAFYLPNLLWVLFAIFGVAAIVLTVVGLYGVVAFGVAQRTQEIGVRMAFGARARDILGMVLKQGLVKVAIGLSVGLFLGAGLGQALQAVLFQVDPLDPVVFALVPVLLVAIALLACWMPARRASAVDPLRALHYE